MKPRLYKNTPVGSRKWQGPLVHHICECRTCVEESVTYDPSSRQMVPGKLCTRTEYQDHLHREKLARVRDANDSVSYPLARLQHANRVQKQHPCSDDLTREPNPIPQPNQHRERGTDRVRSTQDANHVYRFRSIQDELEIRLIALESIDLGELVFARSPTPFARRSANPPIDPLSELDPNIGPYALDCRRTCNSSFLELELWMNTQLRELQELDISDRPKLISIKSGLVEALANAREYAYELKVKEWDHRYELQSQARRLAGKGLTHVIDTSKRSIHRA